MIRILPFLALLLATPAMAQSPVPVSTNATAIFAGGCFWCMESEFESLKGVTDVTSGYAGEGEKPTYEQVGTGETGFKEAIEITYDPAVVSYARLLEIFWRNVDPFDDKGQFCDKGTQYQAAIFTSTDAEINLAKASLKKVEAKFNKKVATQILPMASFYEAEGYHQDYAANNALRYKLYRQGCGRDDRLKELNSAE